LCVRRAYEQSLLEAGVGGERQADAVRQLYQRQLQTPNTALDEVLAEYEAWEGQHGKVCCVCVAAPVV
jgi:hypothetical protein